MMEFNLYFCSVWHCLGNTDPDHIRDFRLFYTTTSEKKCPKKPLIIEKGFKSNMEIFCSLNI